MARPSEYDFEICKEICDKIRDGKNIKAILRTQRDRYPTFPTWCKWKRDNLELLNLYVGAIQDKSESVMDEMDKIQRDVKNGKMEYWQARLLLDTLKWKAAKFYPKMFGTNGTLDITTKDKEITQQVTVFQLPHNGRDPIPNGKVIDVDHETVEEK